MTKLGKKSSQQPFTVCTKIFVGNSAQTVLTNMHFIYQRSQECKSCKMQGARMCAQKDKRIEN